jgi:hypothetical protein
MSIWTLLFLLAFVAMIAMHLRGGHAGHGGGHGCCGGGHSHDDQRDDAHAHQSDETAPDTRSPQDPRQPVGAAGSDGGHGGHRHAC